MNIALKEANESEYWLKLLWSAEIISDKDYKLYHDESSQIKALLINIVKSSKEII